MSYIQPNDIAAYFGRIGQQGLRARLDRGLFCGPCPLGYRYVKHSQLGPVLEIDPVTGPLVTKLFEHHQKGLSMRSVIRKTREMNISGQRGNKLVLSTLQRILTAPVYKGLIKHARGDLVEGNHPPLYPGSFLVYFKKKFRNFLLA